MIRRRTRAWAAASGVLTAVALGQVETLADATADGGARRAQVVARIAAHDGGGRAPRTITVGELEDRIAAMAPWQRASFGATADAVRRGVLNQVVVRDALLETAAGDRTAETGAATAFALERARSNATLRAIRKRVGPPSAVSLDDVRAYYEKNRDRYDTPERIQIWRILCQTRDDAQAILTAVLRDPSPKTFADLARDKSVDKATALRSGNVGFVAPDGVSSEPGLHVDAALVKAAQAVHDGDVVPAPVAEGRYYSVVWRRGTRAAARRTLDEAAPSIRDLVWKERIETETDKLVASLRQAHVRDVDDSLLTTMDVPSPGEGRDAGPRRPRALVPERPDGG